MDMKTSFIDVVRSRFADGKDRYEIIDEFRGTIPNGTLYVTICKVQREIGLPPVIGKTPYRPRTKEEDRMVVVRLRHDDYAKLKFEADERGCTKHPSMA